MKTIQDDLFTVTTTEKVVNESELRARAARMKDAWRRRIRASARMLAQQEQFFIKRESLDFYNLKHGLPAEGKTAFASERKRLMKLEENERALVVVA